MQKFANRLASLRNEHFLTQEDLAKIINKKRSTICGYETEGKSPNFKNLCTLAKYFDVSTDYLLGITNLPHYTKEVFFNDKTNFKKKFESLDPQLQDIVGKIFDSFYLLLSQNIQISRPEHLQLYLKLFQTIQSLRFDIRKHINSSNGQLSDVVAFSKLISLQSELKNNVSSILDELIQADMQIALKAKKLTANNYQTSNCCI